MATKVSAEAGRRQAPYWSNIVDLYYILSMHTSIRFFRVFLVFGLVFFAALSYGLDLDAESLDGTRGAGGLETFDATMGADGDGDTNREGTPGAVVSLRAETGFLAVPYHTIQFGEDGDTFDYRTQGGQEILFPFSRFSGELEFSDRHEVEFLYQPLTLETRATIPEDETVVVDGETFGDPPDDAVPTPLDLTYGFDFWRGTYRYRFVDSESWRLSAGGGLQLRNASISFETADGEKRVISQDLGPVPVLSVLARYDADGAFFAETTVEGFYAPIRYLNLSDVDVIGWLYDVGLRAGLRVNSESEAFAGLRATGGGADGTGGPATVWTQTQSEPRYTANNLNTVSLYLGARVYLTSR